MAHITDLIICNRCHNENLDNSCLNISSDEFEGVLKCNACGNYLHFEKGILNLFSEGINSKNESRNSNAYSDFWERGKEFSDHEDITHEDKLIQSWKSHLQGNIFLDAGCGNGRHMKHWISNNYEKIIFLDISDAILDCKESFKKLKKDNQQALFIKGALDDIPIKTKSIDTLWSSGTLCLCEDQNEAFSELARLTNSNLNVSVITEKTITGKFYLWANLVKPITNRVSNYSILYKLTGIVAHLAYLVLRLFRFLNIYTNFLSKETLEKITSDPKAVKRIQWGLYDPVIIPKLKKYPDQFYVDLAKQNGFNHREHSTELISDYYFFKRQRTQ